MIRLVTYNVHRCVGTDRRLDVGRIAAVVAALQPDIVALQELDVGRVRTGGVDQAEAIARRLDMRFHFHPAMHVEAEQYGDAVLTRLPERLVRRGPLPGYPRLPGLEPRGALWLAVDTPQGELQVANTHLGLVPAEQRLQAMALAGPDWMGHAHWRGPAILTGDFNAGPGSAVYRLLSARMREARSRLGKPRSPPSFPSHLPLMAIDHAFVSPQVRVLDVATPKDRLSRTASDHLPLVIDFTLEGGPERPTTAAAASGA